MDGDPSATGIPSKACQLQVVDFDFETKVERAIELVDVSTAMSWSMIDAVSRPEASPLS